MRKSNSVCSVFLVKRTAPILAAILLSSLTVGCVTMVLAPVAVVSAPFQAGAVIANGRAGYYGITEAEWLASGEQFVFTYRGARSSTQRIYLFNLANGTAAQLTTDEEFNFGLLPSPKVNSFVFAKRDNPRRDESQRLYIWTDEGALPRRVTSLSQPEGSPQWSSDGQSIVFVADHSVYVTHLPEFQETRLTPNNVKGFYPSFVGSSGIVLYWTSSWYGHSSPIASSTYHDFTPSFVQIESTRIAHCNKPSFYFLASASVAPDGKTVLLQASSFQGGSVANLDVDKVRQSLDSDNTNHDLDPIGALENDPHMTFGKYVTNDKLLYGNNDGRHAEVWTRSLKDSSKRQLTRFETWIVKAAISPDESKLLVIVNDDRYARVNHLKLHILDIASGDVDTFDSEWMAKQGLIRE